MREQIHDEMSTAVLNIRYLQGLYGVTDEVMAQKMGISRGTWANRKQKPQTMTLKELNMAAGFFRKKGLAVRLSQLLVPFSVQEVDPAEVKQ